MSVNRFVNNVSVIISILMVACCSAVPVFAQTTSTNVYTSSSKALYCPSLSSGLAYGVRDMSVHNQVSELQKFLAAYYSIDSTELVTGYFGRTTQKYVLMFQRQQGISATGVVGTLTRIKIATICSKFSPGTTSSSSFQSVSANITSMALTSPATQPGPLLVDNLSHVIVMEYEAWFNKFINPQIFSTAKYTPLLTSSTVAQGYDSTDPAVIAQHIQWLNSLGVDAIIAEQSNGGPCDYGDEKICAQFLSSASSVAAYTATIHAINQGTFNLYPAFQANNTKIKIIPMVDGQDALMFQPRTDGRTPFDVQVDAFYSRVMQYPNLNVVYQGKPLLLVFLGASQNPSDPNSIINKARAASQKWQDRFTVRLMAGYMDSQPSLWTTTPGISGLHEVNSTYQTWSWIDRLNSTYGLIPGYTKTNGRVEAFTITNAAPSTNGPWDGNDATLYRNGATFDDFLNYAKKLNPIFLIVNQFNEYAIPDEGDDIEHSNDIEPTTQWGFEKFNAVQQKLQAYRTWSMSTTSLSDPTLLMPADPRANFITSLYQCVLGRNPETTSVQAWLSLPVNTTLAYFYTQFFESGEYRAKNISNPEYVGQLYTCILGRKGQSSEIAQWVSSIENGGNTRSTTLSAILNSQEFLEGVGKSLQTLLMPADPRANFITSLYQCVLGRNPETTSVQAWLSLPVNTTLAYFYTQFFESGEYRAKNISNPEYVGQLYTCILGRKGQSSEIAQWVSSIENGGNTRSTTLSAILNSQEFLEGVGKSLQTTTGYR